MVEKVAASFGCSAVEGVLTHRLSSKTIDGEKVIMMKSSIEHNAEPFEIGPSEVYALDIVLSTGDGKVLPCNTPLSLFFLLCILLNS